MSQKKIRFPIFEYGSDVLFMLLMLRFFFYGLTVAKIYNIIFELTTVIFLFALSAFSPLLVRRSVPRPKILRYCSISMILIHFDAKAVGFSSIFATDTGKCCVVYTKPLVWRC